MSTRVRACSADELTVGQGKEFVLAGRVIALFRTSEKYLATDGMCPHAGGPLAQGMLRGCIVTCPWHGWQFDVETGAHKITARIKVGTYPVEIDADGVWVVLPEEQSAK